MPPIQRYPALPAATLSYAEWVPAGRDVKVAGLAIRGGMLYLGRSMADAAGNGVEPALIDPTLPVDGARPDWTGETMDYWPSYSDISPRGRAAYLAWLAGGRSNPRAYIGYVFVYFYGLERRLLTELQAHRTPQRSSAC